jgi:hypothetical protein
MKDTIVESVINQFKQRSEVGINKYGVTLDRTDLSTLEWIQHLQEELFDAVLYIEKLKKEERINIIGQNGNDGEHYKNSNENNSNKSN